LPLPISAGGTEPTISPRPSAQPKVSLRLCRRNIKTFQFELDEMVNCQCPDLSTVPALARCLAQAGFSRTWFNIKSR
jgi:hypothetical protein